MFYRFQAAGETATGYRVEMHNKAQVWETKFSQACLLAPPMKKNTHLPIHTHSANYPVIRVGM